MKKKLISWLLGVALAIPMNFFGGGYFPSQVVYAADNQEVVTAGQRIDIGLSEDGTRKTLSIRDSDKKTEIGSLTWTDENTTYSLSGASGTLTLSGSDGSKDDVSIGYDPDAINKRISAIDTTITGVENNLKSILSAANGTAETKDVREGQTFSSAKGIGISGTMTKVKQEDISVIAAGGTSIKITVKSGAPGSYKYVDDSGDSLSVVDLIDVKDENGNPIAMGDATENQVLSGRTFSNNAGFNKVGTMPDNGAWTSESSGNGKLTIPEGYHNGQGYVDLSGSYNDGYKNGYGDGYQKGAEDNKSDVPSNEDAPESYTETWQISDSTGWQNPTNWVEMRAQGNWSRSKGPYSYIVYKNLCLYKLKSISCTMDCGHRTVNKTYGTNGGGYCNGNFVITQKYGSDSSTLMSRSMGDSSESDGNSVTQTFNYTFTDDDYAKYDNLTFNSSVNYCAWAAGQYCQTVASSYFKVVATYVKMK